MENTTTYLYTVYKDYSYAVPAKVTNVTFSNITKTTAQINFTPPFSEFPIKHYEVRLNGVYFAEIAASGSIIKDMTADTNYVVSICAVDTNNNLGVEKSDNYVKTLGYVVRVLNANDYGEFSVVLSNKLMIPFTLTLKTDDNIVTTESSYNIANLEAVVIYKYYDDGQSNHTSEISGDLHLVDRVYSYGADCDLNLTDIAQLPMIRTVEIFSKNIVNIAALKNVENIIAGNVACDLSILENNKMLNLNSSAFITKWLKVSNKPATIHLDVLPSTLKFNNTYLFNSVFSSLFIRAKSTNFSSAVIDIILNNMAASITSAIEQKAIDLRIGTIKRTSASDDAVIYLQGLGFTIYN